jgi:hypothetical protein
MVTAGAPVVWVSLLCRLYWCAGLVLRRLAAPAVLLLGLLANEAVPFDLLVQV